LTCIPDVVAYAWEETEKQTSLISLHALLRSDVTESVYSSGTAPPILSQYNCNLSCSALWHFPLLPLIHLSLILGAGTHVDPGSSSEHASTLPRDLERQQEVHDRLSGKPGPKTSSFIEMYREKERQTSSGSENLPGKSSSATSIVKQQQQPQQQRSTTVEKGSTPLPPSAPPSSEHSFSPADMPVMGKGGELVPENEEGPLRTNKPAEAQGIRQQATTHFSEVVQFTCTIQYRQYFSYTAWYSDLDSDRRPSYCISQVRQKCSSAWVI
jgi:hypothetical protein